LDQKASWFGAWRHRFGIPLNDPRARAVTYEQAVMDLALANAESDDDAGNAEWLAHAHADRPALDLELAELAGLPGIEDGNTNEEAALARLRGMQQIIRNAPAAFDDSWEIVG
jgi:hypothetical protein